MSLKYSPMKINILYHQRENAKKEWEKSKASKDNFQEIASNPKKWLLLVFLVAVIVAITSFLFSYEVPVDTQYISTYVCYTTDTGECFHASSCSSLRSSRHKTTVYEAENAGYRSCSKCTPTQTISLKLEETKRKFPVLQVTLITVGATAFLLYFIWQGVREKEEEARKQYEEIDGRWNAIPEEFRTVYF